METVTRVLATTSEISLKGRNRMWFERTLTDNVNKALSDLPVASLDRPAWRVLIDFSEPVPFSEVVRRLGTVFGLGAIMPVEYGGSTLESLKTHIGEKLQGLQAENFAIRCLRSDKSFPMNSPEIEREVGRFVQDATGWPVNLSSPDLTLHVLVDKKGLFTWTRRVCGPGGLPADPFEDIFAGGLADDLAPAEVVDYVYRAFQVYMGQQGHERGDEQTALEFLRSLPKDVLLPDQAAERLTRAYVLASYSPREITEGQVAGARETWHLMKNLLAEAPATPR